MAPLSSKEKFGLVFENHLPETLCLDDLPVRDGDCVLPKSDLEAVLYTATALGGGRSLVRRNRAEQRFSLRELVRTAAFGEAVYPYLHPVDSICRARESDL